MSEKGMSNITNYSVKPYGILGIVSSNIFGIMLNPTLSPCRPISPGAPVGPASPGRPCGPDRPGEPGVPGGP